MLRTAVKWVSDPNNPQPAVLGAGGVSLELAPAALRQSRALIRHPLRAAGATRRGGWRPTTTRAIAALGLACQREALAPAKKGRAQRWPVWSAGVQPLAGCACGGVLAGWHARPRAHAS